MLPQYHLTFIWLCYICIHSANFILVEVTTLTDINIEVINFFIMKKIFQNNQNVCSMCMGFPSGPAVKNPPAVREMRFGSWSGRPPEGGLGSLPQQSCLENPTDRGDWQAAVNRVTESQTRLKQLSRNTHICVWYIHTHVGLPSQLRR